MQGWQTQSNVTAEAQWDQSELLDLINALSELTPRATEKIEGTRPVSEPRKRAFLAELSKISSQKALGSLPTETELSAARSAEMLSHSFSLSAVSAKLKINSTELYRRIEDGSAYVIRVADEPFFPTWQFSSAGILPGLKEVVAALPRGLHPLEVEGFMQRRQGTLEINGKSISPRTWLLRGGDPAEVVSLAEGLDEW